VTHCQRSERKGWREGTCVISSKRQNPAPRRRRRRQWRVACCVMEINSFQSTSRAQSVSTGGSCSYYIIIIIIIIYTTTTTTTMCIYSDVTVRGDGSVRANRGSWRPMRRQWPSPSRNNTTTLPTYP